MRFTKMLTLTFGFLMVSAAVPMQADTGFSIKTVVFDVPVASVGVLLNPTFCGVTASLFGCEGVVSVTTNGLIATVIVLIAARYAYTKYYKKTVAQTDTVIVETVPVKAITSSNDKQ